MNERQTVPDRTASKPGIVSLALGIVGVLSPRIPIPYISFIFPLLAIYYGVKAQHLVKNRGLPPVYTAWAGITLGVAMLLYVLARMLFFILFWR